MNSEIKTRRNVNGFPSSMDALKKELISTKKRAEQAENLKSAFLNNISHEIRTPLNGILGFLDFFSNDLSLEDRDQFIEIMRKSGERLLQTVDNIIEMSKLESGNLGLSPNIFNLMEAIHEFRKETEHKYSHFNIDFICSFEGIKESTMVGADRIRMIQIMRNLIDNAFKFTKEGFVKLTLKQKNNILIAEVEDTGIGISNKDRSIIFEPFYQADFKLNRKFEGNGLGLTISKKLIQLMGGDLTYESIESKGAKFICTFPGVIVPDIKLTDDRKKVCLTEKKIVGEKAFITNKDYTNNPFFKTALRETKR